MNYSITFDNADKMQWLKIINSLHTNIQHDTSTPIHDVEINLNASIEKDDLEPFHIVLFACLLRFLDDRRCTIAVAVLNNNTYDFICDDLQLSEYINSPKVSHIDAKDIYNNNLWKIESEFAYHYSSSVSKYLKNTFFKGLDLSPLQVTLDELYANIGDHSKSNGIAYSFVRYDAVEKIINIAFCDFGCGIPTSLKTAGRAVTGDKGIIKKATEIGVSAMSNTHNKGLGLDTVVSNISDSCYLRIISNEELFFCKDDRIHSKTVVLDFDFKGTLIYFDLPITSFKNEEYLGTGDLFTNLNW